MGLPTEMKIYREGRCRTCGWRVTVDRAGGFHIRQDRRCGPVETEHPFVVPDEPPIVDRAGASLAPIVP